MKKRILSVFLTVVMVAGLMTGGVHAAGPVLTEALLAGAESLTQSGERTLDAASGTPVVPSGLDFKSDFYSAYAYSVQLAEDTRLYISFTNIVDETDTFIDIYKDSDTGIIRVTDCDYPTNCGEGYSEVFNAGKYYIVCGFRDSVGSALFSISFEGMSMGEMISRPIEASSLPLNIEAELSPASEGAVCINGKTTPEYPWAVTTNVCVARTYRLDMKAGETIFVSSNA